MDLDIYFKKGWIFSVHLKITTTNEVNFFKHDKYNLVKSLSQQKGYF
jgi:hypothetical protein